MKISIITRCTRLDNLIEIEKSIFNDKSKSLDVSWHILFDTSVLREIPTKLLNSLSSSNTTFHYIEGKEGDLLYPQSIPVIKSIALGWVYYLDDDNILHPEFYKGVSGAGIDVINSIDKKCILFNQFVDEKDFTGLKYRKASPEHTKYQHIDLAQILWHTSIFVRHDYAFIGDYAADGKLIEIIYNDHPEWFHFIDNTLAYYNYLVKPSKAFVPKVIYIGPGTPELISDQYTDFEDDTLNILHLQTDKDIAKHIYTFKPDSIVTVTKDYLEFPELCDLGLEVRNKWVSVDEIDLKDENSIKHVGNVAYSVAMQNMLTNDVLKDMVSWFTPIYNTGEKLYRTYESLKNQTNPYWEWVIVNDSTDGNKTISIAEELAEQDPRIKLYDFVNKSKGIVGEAKYRAAVLCKGELLAEFDHDDYLTPDATQLLYDAMNAYPDAGFYYTDSCEVDENYESLKYGEGFALGYGDYRTENVMGMDFEVQITPNINPKTIRHIVGVPNHIRAWRRDVYFQIGGHNRGLSIADDYELLVRTFLATRMCLIPKLAYLQFIYDDGSGTNTHNTSRRDIQRRVRTVQEHYNDDIANRFKELGLVDWAYDENPEWPTQVESRYGEDEGFANYVYKDDKWFQ